MSEQIDLSKAPEGSIGHGNIGNSNFCVWFSDEWYEYVNSNNGGRYYFGDACVYKEKDIVSCTPRPTTQSWSGEGLPPVGVVCEVRNAPGGWGKATIKYQGKGIIVWLWDRPDGNTDQIEFASCPDRLQFRQIRTAEQIAASERDEAIKKACADIGAQIEGFNVQFSCSVAIRATVEAMIDKGYRKP